MRYWSSSRYGTDYIDFSDGSEKDSIFNRSYKYQVRAIRQF